MKGGKSNWEAGWVCSQPRAGSCVRTVSHSLETRRGYHFQLTKKKLRLWKMSVISKRTLIRGLKCRQWRRKELAWTPVGRGHLRFWAKKTTWSDSHLQLWLECVPQTEGAKAETGGAAEPPATLQAREGARCRASSYVWLRVYFKANLTLLQLD